MLKYSSNIGAADIQAALDTMLSVLKHVNDSMHRKAIVGYQVTYSLLFLLKSSDKTIKTPQFLSK